MKTIRSITILAATVILLAACQSKNNQFVVNDAVSKAEWKGTAPDHFHVGSFKVTGAFTTDEHGAVNNGSFTIPILSIADFDLPNNVKPALLNDLKDNFFKVAQHPNATFQLTEAKRLKADSANYLLTGNFTMLGQTHTVTFPARISTTGDTIRTEAKFNLNRLTWGMNNYSDPKQHLYILPEVNIHLNITASRKS